MGITLPVCAKSPRAEALLHHIPQTLISYARFKMPNRVDAFEHPAQPESGPQRVFYVPVA